MRLLATLIRYELKLQSRSLRLRWAAILYLPLSCLGPALLLALPEDARAAAGSATYLVRLFDAQVLLTVVLAALAAGHRATGEALVQLWPVLAAARMSNAGYLLRRWLAVLALVLSLSVLPVLCTAGIAAWGGATGFELSSWVGAWTLEIAFRAVLVSTLWLGLVTILGSELLALIVGLYGVPLALLVVNQALFRLRLRLSFPDAWTGLRRFLGAMDAVAGQFRGPGREQSMLDMEARHPSLITPATEAPWDGPAALEWLVAGFGFALGLAFCVLTLAVAFVHRTRRNRRPRPIRPDHPLRTLLPLLRRARERLIPDAALSRTDRLVAGAGLLVLLAACGLSFGRQIHYGRLVGERYQAETGEFPHQSTEVELLAWSLQGQIAADGKLAAEVRSTFRNQGGEPHEQLVFALNRQLRIDHLAAGERDVKLRRAWDRLAVTVHPALLPGETLEMEARLSGAPSELGFSFPGRSLVSGYERRAFARYLREFPDFSWVRTWRAISPRRIELFSSDLGPVPRYTTWKLTPRDSTGGGREVPVEKVRPAVGLTIDLRGPPGWFLADPCGHRSRPDGDGPGVRFHGECRTPLADYGVFGGALRQHVGSEDRVTVAALAVHERSAEDLLESLAHAARLSERAWPGMPGVKGLVVIEWPPAFDPDLGQGMRAWSRWYWEYWSASVQDRGLNGQLLLLDEFLFVHAEGIRTEALVADLLARDLLARRPMEPRQEQLFAAIYRSLMTRRMGVGRDHGATVSSRPGWKETLRHPILRPGGEIAILDQRLPAVMADVEGRLGQHALLAGIEAFLAAPTPTPGTIEELLATLEARTGVALDRLYRDYFTGDALPELRLEEVAAERRDRGFVVAGRLRNIGTGEVICPLIVKTETGEVKVMVTVDSESATPFSIPTPSRPHTLVLDPERTCFRYQTLGGAIRERVNLLQ